MNKQPEEHDGVIEQISTDDDYDVIPVNHSGNEGLPTGQKKQDVESGKDRSQPFSVTTLPETRDSFESKDPGLETSVETLEDELDAADEVHGKENTKNVSEISSDDDDEMSSKMAESTSNSDERITVSIPRKIVVRKSPGIRATAALIQQQHASVRETSQDDDVSLRSVLSKQRPGPRCRKNRRAAVSTSITASFTAALSSSEESSCAGIVEPTPRVGTHNVHSKLGGHLKCDMVPSSPCSESTDLVSTDDENAVPRMDKNHDVEQTWGEESSTHLKEMAGTEPEVIANTVSTIDECDEDTVLECDMEQPVEAGFVASGANSQETTSTGPGIIAPTPAFINAAHGDEMEDKNEVGCTPSAQSLESKVVVGSMHKVVMDGDESNDVSIVQLEPGVKKVSVSISSDVETERSRDLEQPTPRMRTRSAGVIGVPAQLDTGSKSCEQRTISQHPSPENNDQSLSRYRTRSAGAVVNDSNKSKRKSLSLRKRKSSGEQSALQVRRKDSGTCDVEVGETTPQEKYDVSKRKKSKIDKSDEVRDGDVIVVGDSSSSSVKTRDSASDGVTEIRTDEEQGWQTRLSDENFRPSTAESEVLCPLADSGQQSMSLMTSRLSRSQGTARLTTDPSQAASVATHISESQVDQLDPPMEQSSSPCLQTHDGHGLDTQIKQSAGSDLQTHDDSELNPQIKQSPVSQVCPVEGQLVWDGSAEGFVVQGLLPSDDNGEHGQPTVLRIQAVSTGAVVLDAMNNVEVLDPPDLDQRSPGSTDSSILEMAGPVEKEDGGWNSDSDCEEIVGLVANKNEDKSSSDCELNNSVEELDVMIRSRRRRNRRCSSVEVLEVRLSEGTANRGSRCDEDRCSSVESVMVEVPEQTAGKKKDHQNIQESCDDQQECSIIHEIALATGTAEVDSICETAEEEINLICETTEEEISLKKHARKTKGNGYKLRSKQDKVKTIDESSKYDDGIESSHASTENDNTESEMKPTGKKKRSTRPVRRVQDDSDSITTLRNSESISIENNSELPVKQAIFESENPSMPCNPVDDAAAKPGDYTVMDTDDDDSRHSVPLSVGEMEVVPPTPPTKPNKSRSFANAKSFMKASRSVPALQPGQLLPTIVPDSPSSQLQALEQGEERILGKILSCLYLVLIFFFIHRRRLVYDRLLSIPNSWSWRAA